MDQAQQRITGIFLQILNISIIPELAEDFRNKRPKNVAIFRPLASFGFSRLQKGNGPKPANYV